MKSDDFQVELAILKIRQDFLEKQIMILLNRKSKQFMLLHGLSSQKVLADAVSTLVSGYYYRRPSKQHGHVDKDSSVFEFIMPLYQHQMYIKFFMTPTGTEFRSLHPAERFPDFTFHQIKGGH